MLSSKSSQGPRVFGPMKRTLGNGITSGAERVTLRATISFKTKLSTKFLPVSEAGSIFTTLPGIKENEKPPLTEISRRETEHVAPEPKIAAESSNMWQLLLLLPPRTTIF